MAESCSEEFVQERGAGELSELGFSGSLHFQTISNLFIGAWEGALGGEGSGDKKPGTRWRICTEDTRIISEAIGF